MPRDQKDGAATTWGAQHFESEPTVEQLRKIKEDEQARDATTLAPQRGVSIIDAAKTIKRDDFLKVHQLPCHRQGYMTGIGAGVALGVTRFLFGGMELCQRLEGRSRAD